MQPKYVVEFLIFLPSPPPKFWDYKVYVVVGLELQTLCMQGTYSTN